MIVKRQNVENSSRVGLKDLEGYDWESYLACNPDLPSGGITTEEQAIQHWKEAGKKEGRVLLTKKEVKELSGKKRVNRKIIITGPGRSGTTFLIRLFTELGFDTGYDRYDYEKYIFKKSNAGLENYTTPLLYGLDTPYIIKSPFLFNKMPAINERYLIDMVFIPMRDLDDVANSRARIGNGPGGLVGCKNPKEQKGILAENLNTLISDLAHYKIPHTFLDFLEFTSSPKYTYEGLVPFIENISYEEFRGIFLELSRKSKSDYYK